MQIDITGQNMEITEPMRRRVTKNLERIGKRATGIVQRAHIVLAVNRHLHSCDVHLDVNGEAVIAKSEMKDMYAAIDQTMEKALRQINTAKGRHNGKPAK